MKRIVWVLLAMLCVASPASAAVGWLADFYPVTKFDNDTDAQTDTDLWDPAADKRIVLLGCQISADAAQTLKFEVSNTSILGTFYLDATAGMNVLISGAGPIWIGAKDAVLTYTTTTAANTNVACWGYEDEF